MDYIESERLPEHESRKGGDGAAYEYINANNFKNLMVNKPFYVKVRGADNKLSFERFQLNPQVMEDQCSFSIDQLKFTIPVLNSSKSNQGGSEHTTSKVESRG
jgi:hypothetical protein